MPLPAETLLSLKYLRPKRSFLSIITLLSLLGPLLGVAVLVIVIAVMSGFDRDIRERILSMQAHLHIYPAYGSDEQFGQQSLFRDPMTKVETLEEMGVQAAPLMEGPVLIQVAQTISSKYLKGIVPRLEQHVTDVLDRTRPQQHRIEPGEVILGDDLARELGLTKGDRLLIHSPAKLTQQFQWRSDGSIDMKDSDEVYLPAELTVAGTFDIGVYKYDSNMLFADLDQAADIFGQPWGNATSIHARTDNPFQMDEITSKVQAAFPASRVTNWQQANRQLFNALRVEKNLMFFLLTFIIVVAAFAIAGTLITTAVQKTREIGILKAIGISAGAIARIFLLQGIIIGFLGSGLGMLSGLLIIRYRENVAGLLSHVMGVQVFPQELYQLESIPALVRFQDMASIGLLAFAGCIAASVFPALYAAFMAPAKALQQENG